MRTLFIITGVLLCATQQASAQNATKPLGPLGDPFIGNVGYYATGNTMGEPFPGKSDGLACLLPSNTATVPASVIGIRATLEKAYLYYSGNVYNYRSGTGGDLAAIDKQVSLQLPGQTTAQTFTAEIIYTAEVADSRPGKSYFYTARSDLTEALKANKTLAGTYTFSNFRTRICDEGPEATCDPTAMVPPRCADENFLATASFFIVLVYKDPALPPRAVKLFDGLEILTSSKPPRAITLDNIQVSAIPRGQITFYGLEGDANATGDTATISAGNATALRAAVPLGNIIDPPPPNPTSLTCMDTSWPNWSNNLFDSSTVLDPSQPNAGECTRGIDIDTYDISAVLKPNDTKVEVDVMTTSTDTFGIAFAAVSVDIFRPVIDVDSRKQVLFRTTNSIEPNGTVVYRVGISNTGNIPATGISVTDSMPLGVTNLKVLITPPGSTDGSTVTGGFSNTGQINVTNIAVNPGDIFEVRYSVDVPCPVADGLTLINSAAISASAEGAKGTTLFSPTLRVSDPNGDICAGRIGPSGPTGSTFTFDRRLLGGAGCSASGGSFVWLSLAALALFRRRGRVLLVVLAAALAPNCTCRNFVAPPVVPGPTGPTASTPVIPVAPDTEPEHPGTVCPGAADMVALGTGVCIDRFEALLDGSTARVTFAAVPTAGVDFNTAASACIAAGKRLCTDTEWELACRGTAQTLYPYGDSFIAKTCNGFDAEWGEAWQAGAVSDCKSNVGAYDMSGNLNEWVNTDYPFMNAGGTVVSGKQLRGGSFIGNASGLTCTALVGADPASKDARAGIRCCK